MIYCLYKEKIMSLRSTEEGLRRVSRRYVYAKLVSFVFASWQVYCAVTASFVLAWWLAAAGFALYIAVCVLDHRCRERIDRLERMIKVCDGELSYLNGDFTPFADGAEYVNADHEYSYDLDIFGADSLFNRINRTVTRPGADRLASMFSHPGEDREYILERQEAIAELKDMTEWRICFLSNLPVREKGFPVNRETDYGFVRRMVIDTPLPYFTTALAAVSFVLGVAGVLPFAVFFMVFTVQLCLAGCLSGLMKKKVMGVERLHAGCRKYVSILNDIHDAPFRSSCLTRVKADLFDGESNSMEAFRRLSGILKMFDWRNNVVIYILFNGIMLFDVMLVRRFRAWSRRYAGYMERWMNAVAETDALVSLATYAFNSPDNVPAEILPADSDLLLEASGVYHPFLSHDKAVTNDFTLKKNNVAIITGANMAGKSTFLRTLGVAYVLACNGVPVCARSFRFSIVSLFSGMRTSDDLTRDISYFKAEILRLRRLVRHVKAHPFTFIILDEILKGTNSQDKLSGSAFFLREIVRYPVSAVIATHDIGLSALETEQPDVYRNYCFEIERGADIRYTYKLHRGVVRNLNASYLLSLMMHEECGTPLPDSQEH